MAKNIITRKHVIARLHTGAVYNDDGEYWTILTSEAASLRAYFEEMGLVLEVDTAMGMGYLRPLSADEEEQLLVQGYAPIPKIIPPQQLGYYPSLMCALLRQALQLHEEQATDSKHLHLGEDEVTELIKPYMPETQDEKAVRREVRKVIVRLEEIGALHKVPNRSESVYRVEPVIRARITLDQLQSLLEQLTKTSESAPASAADGESDSGETK